MNHEHETAGLIVSLLDARAQRVDMRTASRLEKAAQAAAAAHAQNTYVAHSGLGQLALTISHHRMAVFTVLLVLVAMVLIGVTQNSPPPDTYSDAFLLGSELPPEAYVDRGFNSWLNAN